MHDLVLSLKIADLAILYLELLSHFFDFAGHFFSDLGHFFLSSVSSFPEHFRINFCFLLCEPEEVMTCLKTYLRAEFLKN